LNNLNIAVKAHLEIHLGEKKVREKKKMGGGGGQRKKGRKIAKKLKNSTF